MCMSHNYYQFKYIFYEQNYGGNYNGNYNGKSLAITFELKNIFLTIQFTSGKVKFAEVI